MLKLVAYLSVAWIALAGACAQTSEKEPDGQTHWMTQCDRDSDCGPFECICGVCTETCASSATCAMAGDDATRCVPASVLPDDACEDEGDIGGMQVCAPACARGECSAGGPELECKTDGELESTAYFEALSRGPITEILGIAPDDAIYVRVFVTTSPPLGEDLVGRVVGSQLEMIAPELPDVIMGQVEGDDLIVMRWKGDKIAIDAIDHATLESRPITEAPASRPAGFTSPASMIADEAGIYWTALVTQEPGGGNVWSAPRNETGGSALLGVLSASPDFDSLGLLGEDLVFLAWVDASPQLFRLPKDGSGEAEMMGDGPAATAMISDGESLFFSLQEEGELGERIGRMDPDSLAMETLFDTVSDPSWLEALGGDHVYWSSSNADDFDERNSHDLTLWRGRKDGGDKAEQLVRMRSGIVGKPFVHEGWLYLITECGQQPDRALVRLPLL